jgi:4'-phosphopantetheinyl transferase
MVTIYYTLLEPGLKITDFKNGLALLPVEIRTILGRYHHERDQLRLLIGKLLLLKGLRDSGHGTTSLDEITYTPYRKPVLPDIKFNISHSGNMVACAVTTLGEVGIDTEEKLGVNIPDFRKCFSEDEWSWIQTGEQLASFYKLWTKKESVLKACGTGLHDDLASLDVLNPQVNHLGNTYWTKELCLHPSYSIHVTLEHSEDFRYDQKFISIDELG